MKIKLNGTTDFEFSTCWEIPEVNGIYLIHDLRGVQYVGQTNSLRRRFNEHLKSNSNIELSDVIYHPVGQLKFSWICSHELNTLEQKLIQYFVPRCNHIKYKKGGN